LAMGFNFVNLFSYYITIFYLYAGNEGPATELLGYNGTVWAVAGLFAVFPLNWMSRRWGKNRTLLSAILLMCAAQLAKIVCYDPTSPHLIFIPTVLLSAGMLMFFTLGAAMVADICDEDELHTGRRSEGSYYSVYWWFIKMGTAFASFVTGALLVFTAFDEQQNVNAETLRGRIEIIKSDAEHSPTENVGVEAQIAKLDQQFEDVIATAEAISTHLDERIRDHPEQAEHTGQLADHLRSVRSKTKALRAHTADLATNPSELNAQVEQLLQVTSSLKKQAPRTLFRLRAVEIGLPLVLSIVSIFLTLRYPLTEARCYEIKEQLKRRRGDLAP